METYRTTNPTFTMREDVNIEDSHDIEKHILSIHAKTLHEILPNDLVMGMLDEKERKYVSEQVSLAHEAKYLIKEPQQREYAVNRLLLKAVTVVLLNRNLKGNPLLDLLLKKDNKLMDLPPPDLDKQLLEKLDREKRGQK